VPPHPIRDLIVTSPGPGWNPGDDQVPREVSKGGDEKASSLHSEKSSIFIGHGSCGQIIMWSLLKEFLSYLKAEKKWWLIPLVVMLVGFGALLVFGSSSGLGWAIYPFM
jgi:hypothetical protein